MATAMFTRPNAATYTNPAEPAVRNPMSTIHGGARDVYMQHVRAGRPTVVVFYRGERSRFCRAWLRRWLSIPALERRLALSSAVVLFVSSQSQGKAYSLAEQLGVKASMLDDCIFFVGDPAHDLANHLSDEDLLHPVVTNPSGHRAHSWVYDFGMIQPAVLVVYNSPYSSPTMTGNTRTVLTTEANMQGHEKNGQIRALSGIDAVSRSVEGSPIFTTGRAVSAESAPLVLSHSPSGAASVSASVRNGERKDCVLYSWAMRPMFRNAGGQLERPDPWEVWDYAERKLDRINLARKRRPGVHLSWTPTRITYAAGPDAADAKHGTATVEGEHADPSLAQGVSQLNSSSPASRTMRDQNIESDQGIAITREGSEAPLPPPAEGRVKKIVRSLDKEAGFFDSPVPAPTVLGSAGTEPIDTRSSPDERHKDTHEAQAIGTTEKKHRSSTWGPIEPGTSTLSQDSPDANVGSVRTPTPTNDTEVEAPRASPPAVRSERKEIAEGDETRIRQSSVEANKPAPPDRFSPADDSVSYAEVGETVDVRHASSTTATSGNADSPEPRYVSADLLAKPGNDIDIDEERTRAPVLDADDIDTQTCLAEQGGTAPQPVPVSGHQPNTGPQEDIEHATPLALARTDATEPSRKSADNARTLSDADALEGDTASLPDPGEREVQDDTSPPDFAADGEAVEKPTETYRQTLPSDEDAEQSGTRPDIGLRGAVAGNNEELEAVESTEVSEGVGDSGAPEHTDASSKIPLHEGSIAPLAGDALNKENAVEEENAVDRVSQDGETTSDRGQVAQGPAGSRSTALPHVSDSSRQSENAGESSEPSDLAPTFEGSTQPTTDSPTMGASEVAIPESGARLSDYTGTTGASTQAPPPRPHDDASSSRATELVPSERPVVRSPTMYAVGETDDADGVLGAPDAARFFDELADIVSGHSLGAAVAPPPVADEFADNVDVELDGVDELGAHGLDLGGSAEVVDPSIVGAAGKRPGSPYPGGDAHARATASDATDVPSNSVGQVTALDDLRGAAARLSPVKQKQGASDMTAPSSTEGSGVLVRDEYDDTTFEVYEEYDPIPNGVSSRGGASSRAFADGSECMSSSNNPSSHSATLLAVDGMDQVPSEVVSQEHSLEMGLHTVPLGESGIAGYNSMEGVSGPLLLDSAAPKDRFVRRMRSGEMRNSTAEASAAQNENGPDDHEDDAAGEGLTRKNTFGFRFGVARKPGVEEIEAGRAAPRHGAGASDDKRLGSAQLVRLLSNKNRKGPLRKESRGGPSVQRGDPGNDERAHRFGRVLDRDIRTRTTSGAPDPYSQTAPGEASQTEGLPVHQEASARDAFGRSPSDEEAAQPLAAEPRMHMLVDVPETGGSGAARTHREDSWRGVYHEQSLGGELPRRSDENGEEGRFSEVDPRMSTEPITVEDTPTVPSRTARRPLRSMQLSLEDPTTTHGGQGPYVSRGRTERGNRDGSSADLAAFANDHDEYGSDRVAATARRHHSLPKRLARGTSSARAAMGRLLNRSGTDANSNPVAPDTPFYASVLAGEARENPEVVRRVRTTDSRVARMASGRSTRLHGKARNHTQTSGAEAEPDRRRYGRDDSANHPATSQGVGKRPRGVPTTNPGRVAPQAPHTGIGQNDASSDSGRPRAIRQDTLAGRARRLLSNRRPADAESSSASAERRGRRLLFLRVK